MELGALSIAITADTNRLQTSVATAKEAINGLADVTKDGSVEMQQAFDNALGVVTDEIEKINRGIEANQASVLALSNYYDQLAKSRDQALKAGDVDTASDVEEKMAKVDLMITEREKLIKDSQTAVDDLNRSMEKSTTIEPPLSGWGKFTGILGSMNGVIGGVYNDMMKLVQACKAFVVTPIGAIVTAITLAFKALSEWLNGTAEGQEKLALATGYLEGVMNVFKDIVKGVGESIFNLFGKVSELWKEFKKNPLESITQGFKNLGSAILNNVAKRLEGLSTMFSSFFSAVGKAFQGEWAEAGNLLSEAGKGLVQATIGFTTDEIVDGFNAVTNAIEETINKADEYGQKMAEISLREHKLAYEKNQWAVESAKIQEQINKNQQSMYTGTAKTRMKAGREMIALMQQQYGKEVEIAQKELQIQKDKMALSKNSQQDYLKQYQLEAQVAQKRAQMESAIAGVMRRLHSAEKQAIYETAQYNIDAMQDGFEKEQAQRDLNRRKEVEAIEMDRDAFVKAELDKQKAIAQAKNQAYDENEAKKNVDTSDYDVDIQNVNRKYDVIDLSALQSALGQWRDYEEQRLEIEKQYNSLISRSRTEEEAQSLEYAKQEAIKTLNESQLQGEGHEYFDAWKQSLSDMGLTELQRQLDVLQRKFRAMQSSGTMSKKQLAQIQAQMDIIGQKIKSEQFQLPSSVEGAWKDLRQTMSRVSQSMRDLGGSIGDAVADMFESTTQITDCVFESINGINQLVEVASGAMTTTATTASSAIKAVEMASVILAIIGAVMQAVQAVIKLLSRESEATKAYIEEADQVKRLSEVWDQALQAKRAYYEEGGHSTEQLKQNFDEEVKIIENEIKAYRELAQKRLEAGGSIGSHTYGYRMWEGSYTFDGGKTWKDIAQEISDARGVAFNSMSDLTKMSAEDLQWIRENYASAWANLEGEFKGTLNTIIDSETKLSEASEAYQESILGTTWSDFRDDALSALYDVETTAEDITTNISESMRKAMIKNLYNTTYDQQMKQLYDKWQTMAESEGVLTEAEKAELEADAQRIAEEATKSVQGINELFGQNTGEVSTLSGAIANASQESIDLLAGQTNAVRINQIDGLDIMRDQLAELAQIRTINTTMASFLDKINSKLSAPTTSQSLRSNGVLS